MRRPVIIAGGGLSGLSLGIALRKRGVPVELHEAGSYPRHRVCGEFISGVRDETLEMLGIADILRDACPQRTTAWYFRGRKIFHASLSVPARGISRHVLDDRLRRRLEELGGMVRQRSRLEQDDSEGLVWCAGRAPARGEWIGLKCHAQNVLLDADLEMHLGRNAYAGLAKIDSGTVNICGIFRQDKTLRGDDVLLQYLRSSGLGRLADRIGGGLVETSRAAVAGFHLGWQAPRHAALGDACAMIPPFTGNGMSMAFESAALAVRPIVEFVEKTKTWSAATESLRRELRAAFSRRMLFARAMHPFLVEPAGQAILAALARSGLMPFHFCLRLLR